MFMLLCLRLTNGHMINLYECNPKWSCVNCFKQIRPLDVGMVTLTSRLQGIEVVPSQTRTEIENNKCAHNSFSQE